MDRRLRAFSDSFNGVQLGNRVLPILSHPNIVARSQFDSNTFLDNNFREFNYPQPVLTPNNVSSYASVSPEDDSQEDCDFSDVVLKYINQMLMEEDMEDKTCMLQESLELQAAEKSFYEVLGKKYPLLQSYTGIMPFNMVRAQGIVFLELGATISRVLVTVVAISLKGLPAYSISQSPYGSSTRVSSLDGQVDSPSSLHMPDLNTESQSVWQFKKGVEVASRFLPGETKLVVNLEANGLSAQTPKVGTNGEVVKVEKKDEGEYSPCGSRGRKNLYREDDDVEESRSSKQAAVSTESTLRSEMFDTVLLCSTGEGLERLESLREALQNGMSKSVPQNGQSKGSNGGKGRGKKQTGKREVVDLRTLLISCAQAVAADDHRSANELLKKVRQHSSPFGDGTQRLAHCLADGLEARLAGTGSQIYKALVSKRTSAADVLKAYHLLLAASPFRKISNFVSNKTIMNLAQNATRVHVIDFGILYGFQWPTLIQRISWRDGGPPRLRITGIEFPQPGFRPAERVEETGRRLAAYAEKFNVPFEYNAIAKNWDTIKLEELKIDRDEVLVVNFLYRGKNLLDESVAVDSPRNRVLDLIRRINPDLFIHGIVNGAFNAPFFVTRFREALFHFSSLFDMLETVVPREDRERMLIEAEIFGWEALNVIACEGWERVERPETYKQWQVRNLRAGFVQLPLDRWLVKRAGEKVRSGYTRILSLMKIAAGCCRDGRDELSMPFLLGNLLKKLQKAHPSAFNKETGAIQGNCVA
ncbi:scarecrow-like protein 9 [Prunus yedoensis var. nudiflora]|uniref:Scarecrow-like protein 9 n=1 Tax=Prunus yedoensis var. nudiflora TaxID=2094558 RepID=A0A314YUN7_PRUYE|nr:scarecrow-like protein 9 [Prunus yedoensis var. nudiflora]